VASVSRFVGVGIGEYDAGDLESLEYAVAEVRAVGWLLGAGFVGEPICDATEGEVRAYLKALAD
jgi:hypothetical protein